MSTNTYEKQSGIISALDIEKKLLVLNQQQAEPGSEHSVTAETMYGSELPFYFLYKDAGDAEGVKQTHVRLLDLVAINGDQPGKAYLTGDIAIALNADGFYSIMSGVEVCVIVAETPDDEQHHAVVLRHEIDKVYHILKECNEAGKEVTVKFHPLQEAIIDGNISLDMEKGDDHVAG